MMAAGFGHRVVVAHNGCLQLKVTVHGDMAHTAIPDSGTDAMQGAAQTLNALYALNHDLCPEPRRPQGDVRGRGPHPPLP